MTITFSSDLLHAFDSQRCLNGFDEPLLLLGPARAPATMQFKALYGSLDSGKCLVMATKDDRLCGLSKLPIIFDGHDHTIKPQVNPL